MKKVSIYLSVIILFTLLLVFLFSNNSNIPEKYYFEYADKQLKNYHPPRKDYVIVIDYRKHIFSERLYVLDMKEKKIIIASTVSHAWNSGIFYAKNFTNKIGTNTSCKGNFLTGTTYHGRLGYCMRVNGLDNGINDNALDRAILFHSTKPQKTPWSWGCFATPDNINSEIIEHTKNGVLVCVID